MRNVAKIGLVACLIGALESLADSDTFTTFMTPVEDGTLLETHVFYPASGTPAPVLLGRTPYAYFEQSAWYDYGITYAQQATRGQWGSEGVYAPFELDGPDGRDLADWVRQQAWCDGRIGFFAGSAKGTLTALSIPGTPDLACFILRPSATDIGSQFIYQGGVYRKGVFDIWLNQWSIDAPELESRWRAHPANDLYWEQFNMETRAAEVTAPGLHIAGYYDVVVRGTINFFTACQYRGGPGARYHQRLILRATAHVKYDYLEGLTFNFHPNYLDFDPAVYEREFARYYLLDIDQGITNDPPVFYYVIGDDKHHEGPGWEMRTALRWPPLPPRKTWFYLYPDASLGMLPPDSHTGFRSYTYDPANPVPSLGGQNIKAERGEVADLAEKVAYGPYDQNLIGNRDDVIRFYSDVLDAPLETTGNFTLHLFVGSDVPDTDFTAKVVDVYPSGDDREILLLDNIQRVKYRHGRGVDPSFMTPGEVIELTMDLGDISWIFNTGHRIGLHISSSNYPRFDVNPNNGEDIPARIPFNIAHNIVYANAVYPSALGVPVRTPAADTDGDGMADEAEWDDPNGDMDNDGLPDEEEYFRRSGLDVFNADTDDDGWTDGAEDTAHTSPTDPESYPNSPTEPRHSGDTNFDLRIELSELLRLVQFFNSGGYHCDAVSGTEDGYAPGPGADHACSAHDSDYLGGANWEIALTELLRLIQLMNSGGYHPCPEDGTEDGYCPGP